MTLCSLNVIKEKILAALAELPNYTCTETVDRSRKRALDRKFEPLDRVRVEIAVVGHNELFGWPGSRQIVERDVTRMVPGFIGSGDFAMHVRELFVRPEAEFVPVGEEQRGDHRALRYDYRVPVEASGWRLRGRTQDLIPRGTGRDRARHSSVPRVQRAFEEPEIHPRPDQFVELPSARAGAHGHRGSERR